MADRDDPADAASRLEEALERIARLAGRPTVAASRPDSDVRAPDSDKARIAMRLDALIAQLRAALNASTGG